MRTIVLRLPDNPIRLFNLCTYSYPYHRRPLNLIALNSWWIAVTAIVFLLLVCIKNLLALSWICQKGIGVHAGQLVKRQQQRRQWQKSIFMSSCIRIKSKRCHRRISCCEFNVAHYTPLVRARPNKTGTKSDRAKVLSDEKQAPSYTFWVRTGETAISRSVVTRTHATCRVYKYVGVCRWNLSWASKFTVFSLQRVPVKTVVYSIFCDRICRHFFCCCCYSAAQ